ncbi:MAG: hydrogen gas-evolving membrane-bound hydrogenase subunit E [Candidatus Woesearchaeota archaeon]
MYGMREFGAPTMSEMDDHFIAHGQEETGANNIVTSIVFDYRGFDTLGEATVLFSTVLGIGVLFDWSAKRSKKAVKVKTNKN